MTKKLTIKNQEGKDLGEIIFSEGRFELHISPQEEKEKIETLLNSFFEQGIRDLGEIILKEPIKSDDPLFFDEVANQLARRGYVPVKEK